MILVQTLLTKSVVDHPIGWGKKTSQIAPYPRLTPVVYLSCRILTYLADNRRLFLCRQSLPLKSEEAPLPTAAPPSAGDRRGSLWGCRASVCRRETGLRALPQALPSIAPPSAAAPAAGPYFSWSSEMRILVLSSEARPCQRKYSEEAASWPVSAPLPYRTPSPSSRGGAPASTRSSRWQRHEWVSARRGASSLALEAGCNGDAVGIFSGVGGRLQSDGGPGVGSTVSSDSLLKQPGPSSIPTSHGKI
jgi:hypothetical protein